MKLRIRVMFRARFSGRFRVRNMARIGFRLRDWSGLGLCLELGLGLVLGFRELLY